MFILHDSKTYINTQNNNLNNKQVQRSGNHTSLAHPTMSITLQTSEHIYEAQMHNLTNPSCICTKGMSLLIYTIHMKLADRYKNQKGMPADFKNKLLEKWPTST